jgi:copper homeostasis protein (lipoprotein)
MKSLNLIIISFALLLSSGCKSQQPNTTSNIWEGRDISEIDETFTGMLPCADCEKIDYRLTMKPDMSWHSRMIYVGKSAEAFEETGRYNVTEDGIVVLNKSEEGMNRFREVPRGLLMLEVNGKEIIGALADRYLLTPKIHEKGRFFSNQGDTIPDKRLTNMWVMIQLQDSILNPDNFMNGLPRIDLSATRHEVSGHDGCNRIRGSFSTKGNTITFGQLITTKIACPHKDWSQKIAPSLSGNSFKFSFGKNRLIFKQDNKVIIILKNID